MEQLVIVLNARLDAAGGAEGERKSDDVVRFFEDCGEGGFQTSFAFLTQPLGVSSANDATSEGSDPLVLYRAYPDEWVLARKPTIGAPKTLLSRDASQGRPSIDELKAAAAKASEQGVLGGLF